MSAIVQRQRRTVVGKSLIGRGELLCRLSYVRISINRTGTLRLARSVLQVERQGGLPCRYEI